MASEPTRASPDVPKRAAGEPVVTGEGIGPSLQSGAHSLQQGDDGPPRQQRLPKQPPAGLRAEHPDLKHATHAEAGQAEAPDFALKHPAHKALAMTALFFPRTLDGRVLFVCVIASMMTPVPGRIGISLAPLLLAMAIWAAIKGRRRQLRLIGQFLAWIIGFNLSITIIGLIASSLALLATTGAQSVAIYASSYPTRLAGYLIAAAIWLLMGVPHQAHTIGLDKEGRGSAQGLLLALLTAAACIFTGAYIGLLHYSALRKIHIGQLAVGTIFTIVLLAPYYKSLARACWRRGVPGFLKISEDTERPWSNTADELLAARQKSNEVRAADAGKEGLTALSGRFVFRYGQRLLGPIVIFLVIITVGSIIIALFSRTPPSIPVSPNP